MPQLGELLLRPPTPNIQYPASCLRRKYRTISMHTAAKGFLSLCSTARTLPPSTDKQNRSSRPIAEDKFA